MKNTISCSIFLFTLALLILPLRCVADQSVDVVVTGIAVDESGKPVPNVVMQTTYVHDEGNGLAISPATTGDGGAFSIRGLVPGQIWIDPGIGWIVVSPTSITVPLTSPLKLVLKKYATVTVYGTVVDTSNTPIAGVDLSYIVSHDTGAGYHIGNLVEILTGADGTYTVPSVPVDSEMLQRSDVTKDGYVFKSGGDVSVANGKIIVSPIVMAQLGGKVDGIVYNGLGKPVAGTWVFSPESGNDMTPVRTDATGHFELTNLLVGGVTVDAAKGFYFSQSTLHAAIKPDKSRVRLPSIPAAPIGPANLAKATMMLTKNINDQMAKKDHDDEDDMRSQAAYIIAEVSPDAAVSFILSTSSITTWDLDSIASARTDSDPAGVTSWALVPIKRMSDNDGRGQTAVDIGLAVAPYDTAAAQPYYDIAVQYISLDHLDEDSISNVMSLTTLAYLLHKSEANDDYAKVSAGLDTLLKTPSKDNTHTTYLLRVLPEELAKIIALCDVDKAIAILSKQSDAECFNSVSGIIAGLVKPNPSAALALYHWIAQDKNTNNTQQDQEKALCCVLPIIYKADPRDAPAKARSINDISIQVHALTDLADIMPMAEAAPLYLEAEDKAAGEYTDDYSPACVASHAWLRDPVLGAKLYKAALTKFVAKMAGAQQTFGQAPSRSDFAFYYSRIDPAYSRVLLESQFAGRNPDAGQFDEGDSAQSDVAAMCTIDINRAVEMAGQITDKDESYSAGLKPAQYVLLTPEQRLAIPFSDWDDDTEWVPGKPSN